MFSSTNQVQNLGQNANGPQHPLDVSGGPLFSQKQHTCNDLDRLPKQYHIGAHDKDRARRWGIRRHIPLVLSGENKAPGPECGRLRESQAQVKNFTSYEHVWDTELSHQIEDYDLGERQDPMAEIDWPSSMLDLGHQERTYPSPPADEHCTGDFETSQAPAEDEDGPRNVLQPMRLPTVRVPTINLPQSETYGERDDFPDLFAETYADLRPTPSPVSPVARIETPESSTSNFESFASPAFSTEGIPGTPTIEPCRPMFTASRYWDDIEQSERMTSKPSAWWNNRQGVDTLPRQRGTDGSWPSDTENCHLFPQNEGFSFFSDCGAGIPTAISDAGAIPLLPTVPQDTSQALPSLYSPLSPYDKSTLCENFGSSTAQQDQDSASDGMWSALGQRMFPSGNTIVAASSCTYPYIDEQTAMSGLPQPEQGLNSVRFIDAWRSSTQDPSRHDRSNMERLRKNHLLVKWKNEGMSYKDIKVKGNFKDAESTLRGRYRTLTKKKEDRVRKPEWQDRDVRLLREAIMKYAPPAEIDLNAHRSIDHAVKANKISWKSVAQFIWARGGSYLYGNATCKKKWNEIRNGLPEDRENI